MELVTVESTQEYCTECEEKTKHVQGRCVECNEDELRHELIATHRVRRKCLVIVTVVVCLLLINYFAATQYSLDDIMRTAFGAIVTGLGVWFASSLKTEEKITKDLKRSSKWR